MLTNIDVNMTKQNSDYVVRDEALQILGVKAQTLYCYVSRGYIQSVRYANGRTSLYLREDVERMRTKTRMLGHSREELAPATNARVGRPKYITTIGEDGHHYRSRSVLKLVDEGCTFEGVSEYLWSGQWDDEPLVWRTAPIPPDIVSLIERAMSLNKRAHLIQFLRQTVLALGIAEGSRSERYRVGGAPVISARRILKAMVGTLGLAGPKRAFLQFKNGEFLCAGIARGLGVRLTQEVLQGMDTLLVLMADYEMDPPVLAARLAASAGGDLHAGVTAALSVHSASLTGRVCDRVEQIFPMHTPPEAALSKVQTLLGAGRSVPGLEPTHSRYPHGDPRAHCLIAFANRIGSQAPAYRGMAETMRLIEKECGAMPSIEGALVMMSRALGLPDRTASGLYAISRTAGWIAHIFDQRLAGFMVWPRMRVPSLGT